MSTDTLNDLYEAWEEQELESQGGVYPREAWFAGWDAGNRELLEAAKALAEKHGLLAFSQGSRGFTSEAGWIEADEALAHLRTVIKILET